MKFKPGKRKRNANVESGRAAAIADARATKALFCLYNLMAVARSQADIATWITEGGVELEDLYEALQTGADHPVLQRWKQRRTANRPAPGSRERHVRRLVFLLQVALTRAQLTKNAARELVVGARAGYADVQAGAGALEPSRESADPRGRAGNK